MGDDSLELTGQMLGGLAYLESSVNHKDTVFGFTVMDNFAILHRHSLRLRR